MRRKYNNKEADGDKRHHRRRQFLIPLANCNYQQQHQYDNTVSTVATIVTRRNSVLCDKKPADNQTSEILLEDG